MRVDLGLSMKQVAEGSGVCYEAIINWEVRAKRPKRQQFARLCSFYEARGHPLATQLDRDSLPVQPQQARCGPKPRAAVRV